MPKQINRSLLLLLICGAVALSACGSGETTQSPGETVSLWYREENRLVYLPLYQVGEEGARGLTDMNGRQLVPMEYEDILPLPSGYALKDGGSWYFADESLAPRDQRRWQEITPLCEENGLRRDILMVKGAEGIGAADPWGNILIPPVYDQLEPDQESPWGLFRGEKEGRWGYLSPSGEEIIPLIYDYVITDSPTMSQTEGIFVLADQNWGFIPMDSKGNPGEITWGVEPKTAAVYQN